MKKILKSPSPPHGKLWERALREILTMNTDFLIIRSYKAHRSNPGSRGDKRGVHVSGGTPRGNQGISWNLGAT